jgi:hypothetical protein
MAFTGHHAPDFAFEILQPDGGPLIDQLAAWHKAAAAAGRVPVLYLRAVWCPANTKLEATLADPRMHAALRDTAVATCDIDVWGKALGAAGFNIGSVPAFFLLDAGGKPQGSSVTGAAWNEDIAENIAPPLGQFLDAARAARPPSYATPAYAPPAPAAKPGLNVGSVAMLVLAAVLLVLGVYMKVQSADAERKADADTEREQRIRKGAQEAIQRAMREQQQQQQKD